MTGDTERVSGPASELAQLRRDNLALRRQVATLQERLGQQKREQRDATKAKDALITRLQFELTDTEHAADERNARIAQLLEENQRLRDAVVAAASS